MTGGLVLGGDVVKVGGYTANHVFLGAFKQQTLSFLLGSAQDVFLGGMFEHDHIEALVVDRIGGIAEASLGQFHHLTVSLGVFTHGLHGGVHQEFCFLLIGIGQLVNLLDITDVFLGSGHRLGLGVEPSC